MDDLQHTCGFKVALDATRDMVLIKGPESRLLWANKSFRDYYGMTEAQLRDIVDGPQSDPDDTLQYVRDDRMVFEIADHLDIPSESVTDAHGVVRQFHTIKSPIFDDGKVARNVGVSRLMDEADTLVTGLGHLEAKALAKPLRLLTSAFPLAIALTDVNGRVVSTSQLWEEVFGQVPTTDPGRRYSDLRGELAAIDDPLTAALKEGASSNVLVELHDDDTTAVLDVRVGPWSYDDATLGGAIMLAIDITAEAERNAELEDMIVRRTEAELSVREVNDDLEHFVHVAAHDLREPARRQLMLTDLMVDEYADELSPQILLELERVRDQSRKMLAMVDGFRHLSRMTGPAVELKDTDMAALIDEILAELHEGGDAGAEASIRVDVPDSVRGYPTLLRALFRNLIHNAVIHGPRPLDLRIAHVEEGGVVTFSVSNASDRVLSAAEGSRLFKPFVRDHQTADGSGLGLSICKRVVERHNGRIWLEVDDRFDVKFTLGERS